MASELELRTCGRAGCRWPAAASLSFRYETRQVWLIGLAPEPHPALYDLCPHHADALTVPRGWERVDQREPAEAVREPSGHDLEVRAREHADAEPVRVGGGNRYAALAAELPRLAQQYAATAASAAGEPSGAAAEPSGGAAGERSRGAAPEPSGSAVVEPVPGAASHPTATRGAAAEGAVPIPSRELAPLPVEPAPPQRTPAPRPRDAEPGGAQAHEERPAEHPGQLAIPMDDVDRDPEGAIVVSIDRRGPRRPDA